ncbi:hypothetical protein ACJX0J_023266, partial [Zea mays]
ALKHNGSLYAHVYFARSGYPVDPTDPKYEQKSSFGRTHRMAENYTAVNQHAYAFTNILFSSGTTATSKFHVMVDEELSFRSFGLNGEALASLSDISVVEGSKCLHLGIDDKREVVGTTGKCSIFSLKQSSAFVVRELFYNQPVRRKQMQSSEKRELHHVKKCVLQIALIHPQISLRLLDNDSEDELLYTEFSSSPLPLISKTFGDDISRCLHEITASDQGWTLSGHISGPADVFCTK